MQTINVLSLGVGVQSSTLLMLADHGLLEQKPDVAIFADTGNEPREVYDYLNYLQDKCLHIPIIVWQERHIIDDLLDHMDGIKTRYANPPFFVKRPDGKQAKLIRVCTKEYKIEMVERAIRREVLGLKPRQHMPKDIHIDMMIGISTDEIERVKPSQVKWMTKVYPLIDEWRMSRVDCIRWMADSGYRVPPRSSCLICPFHSDSEWARLMKNPGYREHIVEVDRWIRNGLPGTHKGVELYLHRSLKPIGDVEFEDSDEGTFAEECEGMCGI